MKHYLIQCEGMSRGALPTADGPTGRRTGRQTDLRAHTPTQQTERFMGQMVDRRILYGIDNDLLEANQVAISRYTIYQLEKHLKAAACYKDLHPESCRCCSLKKEPEYRKPTRRTSALHVVEAPYQHKRTQKEKRKTKIK
ncbi:hypothetical protein EVAR_66639_1 [Eumeta japonica]|uniref:Uncharacterized protein n=1 Tax=Eumeta variegata TaxID=151549 RepID=A0A4C1ZWS0_EUMVA|nr:hypothetical protein EVAR_66639_1 [Eumeta japonica]